MYNELDSLDYPSLKLMINKNWIYKIATMEELIMA